MNQINLRAVSIKLAGKIVSAQSDDLKFLHIPDETFEMCEEQLDNEALLVDGGYETPIQISEVRGCRIHKQCMLLPYRYVYRWPHRAKVAASMPTETQPFERLKEQVQDLIVLFRYTKIETISAKEIVLLCDDGYRGLFRFDGKKLLQLFVLKPGESTKDTEPTETYTLEGNKGTTYFTSSFPGPRSEEDLRREITLKDIALDLIAYTSDNTGFGSEDGVA